MRSVFLDALGSSQLYPITDRRLSHLSHADQVLELSARGASLIQLREKLLSPLEFYREAEAAIRVARNRGVKIIINDRVDIALALQADGVHLGQDDVPPEAARQLLGSQAIIGFSTHNSAQAELAKKLPIDYAAIGPIFATSTKIPAEPTVGLVGLHQVREIVEDLPLIAIGGITSENKQQVLDAGADAVAIISDLWPSQ